MVKIFMETISSLKHLRFINQESNALNFEIGVQQFQILIPEDADGFHMIELPIILKDYQWLGRVNEYVFDKQPTLGQLLEHIDGKYEQQKVTQSSRDIFDIPELKISQFDLEEQKYRKKLETELNNHKSNLALTSNKTVALFSGNTTGMVIINEFFAIRNKYSSDSRIEINLTNHNIYHWNIKLRYFSNKKLDCDLKELNKQHGYNHIELEMHFHDKLYPSYPPFIKPIRPKLLNNLMNRITNMKMIQLDYWTPSRNMEFVINKLLTSLDKHCTIDINSEMNDITKYPNGAYHSLESILIKLASLCDIKDDYEPLDDEEYKQFTNIKQSNQTAVVPGNPTKSKTAIWQSGTGYGNSKTRNWDPAEYVKLQKEKDSQIQSVINTVIDNMNNYKSSEMPAIYDILNSSYLIPFLKNYMRGSNLLEMSTHMEMYKLLLTFMQLLATEESIFIFDNNTNDITLYQIISTLYKEAKYAIALSKDSNNTNEDIAQMICVVFEMVTPIYETYTLNKQKQSSQEQQIKTNPDSEHQTYIKTMGELNFDLCNFKAFHYKIPNTKPKPSTIQRLTKEYAAFSNSLPIFFESSIFVRVNEKDTRCMKVLITGPDNTPYDSGCLIFDVLISDDYPNSNPSMIFINHGGKRFNPNLYECGKVCLSLLGTWRGHGGENWNPTTSTLQQLLISVQAQILVPEPFYNEPGYETSYNNPEGKETSRQYTNERRWFNMCHTIYDLLTKPEAYPEFADVIKMHFTLKKDYIKKLLDNWTKEPNNKFAQQTQEMADKINIELDKLN